MASAFDKLRIVRGSEAIRISSLVSLANDPVAESLRRLRVIDAATVERALDAARFHLLDRINRAHSHQRRARRSRALNDDANLVGANERAHSVVNDDDARVLFFDYLKAAINRVLPFGPAAHDASNLFQVVFGD